MIPKKIHFIWLGKTVLKEEYKNFIQAFNLIYNDYEIKVWYDDDVNFENIVPDYLKTYYEDTNFPPAFKSDILRYLIINKYGGLYFDTDFEPLKKIPDVFLQFDFLGGIQNNGEIAIGFFGSEPNNMLLHEILKSIPDSIEYAKLNGFYLPREIYRITGPEFFNKIAKKYVKENSYFFFTREYFYPYWFNEFERRYERFIETSPLSYAVHHWQSSWIN